MDIFSPLQQQKISRTNIIPVCHKSDLTYVQFRFEMFTAAEITDMVLLYGTPDGKTTAARRLYE